MQSSLKKAKVLLLDDDKSFLKLVEITLRDIGIRHLCLTTSYQEAVTAWQQFKPSICLLDIELKGHAKNGIDVARHLREQDPYLPIVFMTSHFEDDYYEEVKSIGPSRFMNKEISRLKLLQTIELTLLQLENVKLTKQLSGLSPKRKENRFSPLRQRNNQLFFKIGDTFKGIDRQAIDYFFAENKMTYARVGSRNYPTNVQLKTLECELSPIFARCHKKYLVNVDRIESIALREGRLKIGTETLSIGYAYRKSFLDSLQLLK